MANATSWSQYIDARMRAGLEHRQHRQVRLPELEPCSIHAQHSASSSQPSQSALWGQVQAHVEQGYPIDIRVSRDIQCVASNEVAHVMSDASGMALCLGERLVAWGRALGCLWDEDPQEVR